MTLAKRLALFALLCFLAALAAPSRAAPTDRQSAIAQAAKNLSQLPPQHQALLSSAQLRILQINELLTAAHPKFGGDGGPNVVVPKAAAALAASTIPGPGPGGTTPVSDPRLDFTTSAMTGFTQSESSSATCGSSVVVGYNDSGAFARTAGVNYSGAWSFSSSSYSTDGGRTFTSAGYLNPGTNPVNFLVGDPVIACTSASQFYYASIYGSGSDAAGNFFNGVALNASSDGGKTWGPPVAAVAKDFNHGIDKPWLAADPTNAKRLYVTYTDFDYSGFFGDPAAACPNDIRYAIELVSSADAGSTWSAPVVVHQECYFSGGFNGVQGSNPAVAADGTLYIGYEFFPGSLPTNEIHLARSSDHGATIAADVKVADLVPIGNFGALQGLFRTNEFPQVAIDRSSGRSRGAIYVAYSSGAANVFHDLPIVVGTYAYPDVLVAKSIDGGKTFSVTTPRPTPAGFSGRGRDQFFPGIAVDRRGNVGLCYYDRRQSPLNSRIDRYCATSENGGASWSEEQISEAGWAPSHGADAVINASYIGDYDAVSSDFLQTQSGFFGSFEVQTDGNPDVVGSRF
jgi:hypothetical protein